MKLDEQREKKNLNEMDIHVTSFIIALVRKNRCIHKSNLILKC